MPDQSFGNLRQVGSNSDFLLQCAGENIPWRQNIDWLFPGMTMLRHQCAEDAFADILGEDGARGIDGVVDFQINAAIFGFEGENVANQGLEQAV